MRIVVAVNDVREIGFRQTTALLVAAFIRKGCEVWIAGVNALSITARRESVRLECHACLLPFDCLSSANVESVVRATSDFRAITISPKDVLLIRTNPGRDVARSVIHQSFLHLCQIAERNGIRVINAPMSLPIFACKSSLAMVDPEFRPPMIVSSRIDLLCEFVRSAPDDCVVKPLAGSRGKNVIRVSNDDDRLESTIGTTFGDATLVAQYFVTADHPGDRRIVTLDGNILEVDGCIAGIERHPAVDDFRANLHAGGSAHPVELNQSARAAVKHAAGLLSKHRIRLAGIDLIGDQIIELNVFSTGGIYDANRFYGASFEEEIVCRLLATDGR